VPTPTETVHLPDSMSAQVEEEARRSYPAEACGFLLGNPRGFSCGIE